MRARALHSHCHSGPSVQRVGLVQARKTATWDADISRLFALFDIRGDGVIQPDEFVKSQLCVANAIGLEVEEDDLPDFRTVDNGQVSSQPPLARSRTVDALRKAGFNDVDVDGDGCISFDEFKRWLLILMETSTSSLASKRRHLSALIRELERRMKVKDPAEWWVALEAMVDAAQDFEELDAAISKATAKGHCSVSQTVGKTWRTSC